LVRSSHYRRVGDTWETRDATVAFGPNVVARREESMLTLLGRSAWNRAPARSATRGSKTGEAGDIALAEPAVTDEPKPAHSEVLARLIEQSEPKATPPAPERTVRERLMELYAHD
jgi:hypothetical protein